MTVASVVSQTRTSLDQGALIGDVTPYDRVPYSNRPFRQTQPDYLAMVASLFGMKPAPPSRCRVLELGCGGGDNILPMAYRSPDSEFVGIDLSGRAIEAGQAMLRKLSLSNVSLLHRDIMDISEADGRFDYIIAHGVYSWVPPAVRDKILSVFATNLSPQGVAYVSYNALPGAHLRDMARSMLLFHVRNIGDPLAKSAQARSLMRLLAQISAPDSVHGVVLRDQAHRIESLSDEVFIHDDLDEGSAAFFLHQVVGAASRHRLQYLADSDFPILGSHGRAVPIAALLSSIPEEEAAVRDQYMDFIDGRQFRTSLFCHQNVILSRPAKSDCMRTLFFSGALYADESKLEPASEDVVVFKANTGESLRTNQPLAKAALVVLNEIAPEAIGFDGLIARAMDKLGTKAPPAADNETAALSNLLFQAVRTGLLDAHYEVPRLTSSVSERPRASSLARLQLAMGSSLVTNLLHRSVACEDHTLRRFIPLVDGTRGVGDLRDELERTLAAEPDPSESEPGAVSIESVQRTLSVMAKLALLER